jgi:hypothetical protein
MFNAGGGNLSFSKYNDFIGDITVLAWGRFSKDQYTSAYLLNGGSGGLLCFYAFASERFAFRSDGATSAISDTIEIGKRDYFFIAITRKADGTVNFYLDGKLFGTADQNSGTPAVGTGDIIIGNNFYGVWDNVVVTQGLLTPEEISQYYTATKHKYGK